MVCHPTKPTPCKIGSILQRRSRGFVTTSRRVVSGIALATLVFASVSTAGRAHAAGPSDAADSATRVAARPLDLRWRARGVAFIDLPFGLRARYDAQALYRLSARDDFNTAVSGLPTGAAPHSTRLLESRFALSHVLAPRIELELSWAARSPLTRVDLLRIEDQRVAAMIRFVP